MHIVTKLLIPYYNDVTSLMDGPKYYKFKFVLFVLSTQIWTELLKIFIDFLIYFRPGDNFINMLMWSFYSWKCFGVQLLFHQQYYAQLYQCTQLEVTPNFYDVLCTQCTSKISLNLLSKKLLVKCWWNWHQGSCSPTFNAFSKVQTATAVCSSELVSISSTFYARVFCTKVCSKPKCN